MKVSRSRASAWLAVAVLASSGLALSHGCGGEGTGEIFVDGAEGARSQRLSRILAQSGDAVIVPAYEQLAARFAALETAAQAFCAQPSAATLTSFQAAWKQAATAWTEAGVIQFGPIREENRNLRIQFWPDDNNNVERAVEQMLARSEPITADFLKTQSVPAQGLSGLEVLLFEGESPLAAFQDPDKGRRRCDLALAESTNLRRIGEDVEAAWARARGNYVDGFTLAGQGSTTFLTRDDALEELVNSLITAVERTKNNRLGDPIGVGSSSGPRLNRAEAHRSDTSLDNVRAALDALERFYYGGDTGTENFGFDDFLGLIGRPELDQRIKQQLEVSIRLADSLPSGLSVAVADPEDRATLDELYDEVTTLTRLIKNDLSVAAGVVVGFNENDGD